MDQLAQASWSGAVKSENVRPVFCSTCLSSNRTLYPMFQLMHLSGVCNGVQLTQEDSVCWECRALLKKFALFKARAVYAKSTLTMWLQINQFSPPDQTLVALQSLSTLKHHHQTDHYLTIKDDRDALECFQVNVEFVDAEIKNEPSPQQDATENFEDHDIDTTERFEDNKIDPKEEQIDKLLIKLLNQTKERVVNKTAEHAEDEIESDVSAEIKLEESVRVVKMSEGEMQQQRECSKDYFRFKNAKFKCESCIKYFRSEEFLDKHLVLHSESAGQHGCSICELRFDGAGALDLHVKSHYRYYECRACSFKNPQRVNVIKHWNKSHSVAVKCTKCKLEFRSLRHLNEHIKFAHEDDVTCKTCKKVFTNKYILRKHMAIHTDLPSLTCDVCHKVFKGDWRLQAHQRIHRNPASENAYCAECDVQFKNIYLYHHHLKTTSRHVDPADRKFECSDCGKRFVRKNMLRLHIELVHLKKSNHTCDICGQSFNARLMLTRHKREKHSNRVRKRMLCDICGKGFTVRKCLIEHANVHSGARPFACGACPAAFGYRAALYNHTRLVHAKRPRARRTVT